jgi:hypothetical protein
MLAGSRLENGCSTFMMTIVSVGFFISLILVFIVLTGEINIFKTWARLIDESKQRRQDELALLESFYRRLKNVTNELLDEANDLDQQSKYCRELSAEWSSSLAKNCNRLVTLGEQLKVIERYLEKGQTKTVRERLMHSLNLALGLGPELRRLSCLERRELDEKSEPTKSTVKKNTTT